MSAHPLRDWLFVDEVTLLQFGWHCDEDGLLWWRDDPAGAVTFTKAVAMERKLLEREEQDVH